MSHASPACRCCGSSDVALHGRKTGRFIRREFEFHRCRACGYISVEPFSGFEIYNDAYYRGAGPDPYVDYATEYHHWQKTDRLLEFADLARIAEQALRDQKTKGLQDQRTGAAKSPLVPWSFGPLVPRAAAEPLRWLDFGCGAGGFLKYLRDRATLAGRPLELTGHDVGSYADLLRRADGFRILDLPELAREPDARFDLVSMIEVIEHLPDPLAPLQLIARLLKPGGLLLLTTGNLESPIARRQGIHYRYCAPEIHVSLFNPRALAALYARVGLVTYPVSYDGAVKFKVLKSLRQRPLLRPAASAALMFPPLVRTIDTLYGVSAMPCAVKLKSSE